MANIPTALERLVEEGRPILLYFQPGSKSWRASFGQLAAQGMDPQDAVANLGHQIIGDCVRIAKDRVWNP